MKSQNKIRNKYQYVFCTMRLLPSVPSVLSTTKFTKKHMKIKSLSIFVFQNPTNLMYLICMYSYLFGF